VKRFVVQTVSGWPKNISSKTRLHVSAHVCDRVYLYEVVATYRSTDGVRGQGSGKRLGAEGAIAEAEAHAARLNDGR
jgi:hypothetical protein